MTTVHKLNDRDSAGTAKEGKLRANCALLYVESFMISLID